eukprot:GEMP01009440.1.p1 GENE.GEMP01009440.1~~GEMP01009440.1.p1  ORF type:complete len:566 (+),score=116.95 GEMP01009440.1:297-1994(+)
MGSSLCKVVESRYAANRRISANNDDSQVDEPHCNICTENHIDKEIEVIFVRHGESQWNVAQKNWALWDMAKRNDHPLSSTGRQQCEDLRFKIQDADDFPPVEVIFSSPLTRAIETAILVFPNHLRGRVGGQSEPMSLVLLPEAREKLNLGGRDSISVSVGQEIVNAAFEDLNLLYDSVGSVDESPASDASISPQTRSSSVTHSTDASTSLQTRSSSVTHSTDASTDDATCTAEEMTDSVEERRESSSMDNGGISSIGRPRARWTDSPLRRASILRDRDMCRINVDKVQREWCLGTAALGEALPDFCARLDDFMHQLMHSSFKYLTDEVCAQQKELCDLLKTRVIPNCGVVQCTMRCQERGRLSISRVRLLYDTTITLPKPKKRFRFDAFVPCCTANGPLSPTLDKGELCLDRQDEHLCAVREGSADSRVSARSADPPAPVENVSYADLSVSTVSMSPSEDGEDAPKTTISPTESLSFISGGACAGYSMGEIFPGHLDQTSELGLPRHSTCSSRHSMPDVPEYAPLPERTADEDFEEKVPVVVAASAKKRRNAPFNHFSVWKKKSN